MPALRRSASSNAGSAGCQRCAPARARAAALLRTAARPLLHLMVPTPAALHTNSVSRARKHLPRLPLHARYACATAPARHPPLLMMKRGGDSNGVGDKARTDGGMEGGDQYSDNVVMAGRDE